MSAAVTEIAPRRRRRKPYRDREVANRVVTNLQMDYAWKIREDAKAADMPPAAFARMLIVEAYRERGQTPKQIKAQYAAYAALKAQAEAEAELAEGDEES